MAPRKSPSSRTPWFRVPRGFVDEIMPTLTPGETVIIVVLFRRSAGWERPTCRISERELARATGLSYSSVWRALRGLEARGLIAVERSGARGGASTYILSALLAVARNGPVLPEASGLVPPQERQALPPQERQVPPQERQVPPQERQADRKGASTEKAHGTENESEELSLPTLSLMPNIAHEFLRAIGYANPARPKRERAQDILTRLAEDGYSTEELREACTIAVGLGARGAELIPHVIGRVQRREAQAQPPSALTKGETVEGQRWGDLSKRFDALSEAERQALIEQAQASNAILGKRAGDHPLVRAAAIGLLRDRE